MALQPERAGMCDKYLPFSVFRGASAFRTASRMIHSLFSFLPFFFSIFPYFFIDFSRT